MVTLLGPQEAEVVDAPLVADRSTGSRLLGEAYRAIGGDKQSDIPWLVQLLENPRSPVALPGKIDLHGHDCLHLLLERGLSLYDEAFIVGFTMGNDIQTNGFHVFLFKLIALTLYPSKYRFRRQHLKSFDLGFWYGRRVDCKNINLIDFYLYETKTIGEIRQKLGITESHLHILRQVEKLLVGELPTPQVI